MSKAPTTLVLRGDSIGLFIHFNFTFKIAQHILDILDFYTRVVTGAVIVV
jgi:hypothetical protein